MSECAPVAELVNTLLSYEALSSTPASSVLGCRASDDGTTVGICPPADMGIGDAVCPDAPAGVSDTRPVSIDIIKRCFLISRSRNDNRVSRLQRNVLGQVSAHD